MPQHKLIRLPDVLAITSLKRSSIYEMIATNSFPRPIKLGSASAWVQDEVHAWVAARIAASRAAA